MFDLFVQQCALEHQAGCVIAGMKFVCYFAGAFHSCPLCGRRVQKGAHACHFRQKKNSRRVEALILAFWPLSGNFYLGVLGGISTKCTELRVC